MPDDDARQTSSATPKQGWPQGAPATSSRVKRVLAATDEQHQRLDARITMLETFSDRDRYGRFLQVQHAFHRDLDAVYADPRLGELISGLTHSNRLRLIEQDLADLGLEPALPSEDRAADIDLPTALGWLYVAEGSKLGAALLLKRAEKLDLSESFGARHLAAAPEGRALHWKTFVAALDAVPLSEAEDARAIDGARSAFARVERLVHMLLVQA